MSPISLPLLSIAGILITLQAAAGSDGLCYSAVNLETGACEDYLGDGVPQEDCCLNIKYGFKQAASFSCEACRPAEWSQWSDWTPCTVSCQEGVQKRIRICIGEGDCEGQKLQVRSCTLQECCPARGGWSEWSEWSHCSVTCQVGQRQRIRSCSNPAPSCGGSCFGHGVQSEICDTAMVCPTHGSWGDWEAWNQCSSGCIVEGSGVFPTQSRFRQCSNPPPSISPPGRPCEGSRQDTKDCTTLPFCPVDGGWGAWQKDSECSVTCGVGRVREKRTCDNPAPRHQGRNCVGSPIRNVICNTKEPCPIDGQWAEWQEWSRCSRLQDEIRCKERVGTQSRRRQCHGQSHNGSWCDGQYRESRNCYDLQDCINKGSWSEWSEWGLCSSPCGVSEKTRFKECLPKYPNYPLIVEGSTKVVEVVFSGIPKVRCDPIDGERNRVEEKTACKNLPLCT